MKTKSRNPFTIKSKTKKAGQIKNKSNKRKKSKLKKLISEQIE